MVTLRLKNIAKNSHPIRWLDDDDDERGQRGHR